MKKFHLLYLSCAILLLGSCVSSKLQYEMPPSPHALTGISQLHIDMFVGQNADFLKTILVQEIYKLPNFQYNISFPNRQLSAAVITGDVQVYSVRDEEEQRPRNKISLIQRDIAQRSDKSTERVRQRIWDFVEIPYAERAIHRTLDLDVRFTLTSSQTSKIIYRNTERISYQQSYVGEEAILVMPSAKDEMERLSRIMMRRFLEKLNPAMPKKILELEKGMAPLPYFFGTFDVGHPRILNGNREAVNQEYYKAIKIWNYVIFAPQIFEKSERFEFKDEVFVKLKEAKLPQVVIQPLLELHNQNFSLKELDNILINLLTRAHFQYYGNFIKTHARMTKNQENINLAATHYNLGAVHRIQNNLELAAYHFAQANAYSPKEKYAQAWTDVQHELGDYNPLDSSMDRTIEAAAKSFAPEKAMLKTDKMGVMPLPPEKVPGQSENPDLQPIELPSLGNDNDDNGAKNNKSTPSKSTTNGNKETEKLDLN